MGINEHPRTKRLANLMGRHPVSWLRIDRGYIPAEWWVVRFDDGSSAFAKIGTTLDTSEWLRFKHRMYSQTTASWLPKLLGWDDDGDTPILALEDLKWGALAFSLGQASYLRSPGGALPNQPNYTAGWHAEVGRVSNGRVV